MIGHGGKWSAAIQYPKVLRGSFATLFQPVERLHKYEGYDNRLDNEALLRMLKRRLMLGGRLMEAYYPEGADHGQDGNCEMRKRTLAAGEQVKPNEYC